MRDGRRGGPGRVRTAGLRDFGKGVPAFAAAPRRARHQTAEEPA